MHHLADCGAPGGLGVRLRDAIRRGTVLGPRVLTSLRPITVPGGHCHHFGAVAAGVEQVAEAAHRLIGDGADFLKVMASGGGTGGAIPPGAPQYSEAELRTIAAVAHRAGKRVVAHCRATAAIRRALAAGVDRLEHVTWEADEGAYDFRSELAQSLVESGVWVGPTIAAGYRAARSPLVPEARRDVLRAHLPQRYRLYRRMAQDAGLQLLCGSDAGTPLVAFDDFALGPELLVQAAGYSAAEALRSATLWGAEALGVADTRGTLEPGRLADLVVLDADPLASPTALRAVAGVLLGGQWVRPLPGGNGGTAPEGQMERGDSR